MKTRFLIPGFILLQACVRHSADHNLPPVFEITDSVHIKYAEGFDVNYKKGGIEIISHAIANNTPFSDTLFLLTDHKTNSDSPENILVSELHSVACQSSTHLAFLSALQKLDLVRALCGMEYIQNSEIAANLKDNGAEEICSGEQVQIETLQKINPDLFLIYPFETEGKQKYNAAGIRTFYIAEYLEQTPLARLEWIKLFGLITGKTREANAFFEHAEQEYLAFKSDKSDASQRFILNLPFKENWFMPSANSMIVNLIEDAGLSYYYPSSGITENETRSTEAVWNDAMFAEYWIIMASRPANFSMKDLLAEESVYKEFNAVKKGQVIFCNTAISDYFVQGVIEPQVILKDILFATGKLNEHQPEYFFLLE